MNKVFLKGLITGAVTSGVIIFAAVYVFSNFIMIIEDKSKYNMEETVNIIIEEAKSIGWKVPTMHALDKSVGKAGYNVKPATVIELCNPILAGKILKNDSDRLVTSMMPCRISVYMNDKEEIIVSRMNTRLISSLFGDNISDIMSVATKDTERIISKVL